jgi:hypothetical protein
LCLLQILAFRAMAISAGVVRNSHMSARIAGILVTSQNGRSTRFDMPHHGELA